MTRIFLIAIAIVLFASNCSKEDSEILSLGERNAKELNKVLKNNKIVRVEIYEFNPVSGEWVLAVQNVPYSDTEQFYVEGNFFVLDNTFASSQSGNMTHEMLAINYFNLEYLTSFDLDSDELFLYFVY